MALRIFLLKKAKVSYRVLLPLFSERSLTGRARVKSPRAEEDSVYEFAVGEKVGFFKGCFLRGTRGLIDSVAWIEGMIAIV